MIIFTLVLFSCSRSGSRSSTGDSELPAAVLTPVDCTNLCPAPEKLVAEAKQSDSVRLRGDLAAGTGQVLLGWDDGSTAQQWFLPAPTTEASMSLGEGIDDLLVWNIRIAIPCFPESAVNVQLTRVSEKAPLTPGTYPLSSASFEVPERDQSTDTDSMKVSGEVVITSTADDRVSGYMQGWASGRLESNITYEDLGPHFEVAAMQFEQMPGDFVAKP